VVAAVVLLVVAVVLGVTLGGGERREPAAGITTDPSFTPGDVVPDAPVPQPRVAGRRDGDRVTFRWRVVGGTKPADTWVWRRPDTGESERTTDRQLTLASPERVCLQVQLVRRDAQSPSTQKCVD
jgi:hypothetical protein